MSIYRRQDKAFKQRIASRADELRRRESIEPKIITVTFDENGDAMFLATPETDIFLELGTVVTQRASHVEPVGFFLRMVFHSLRLFGNKNRIAEWTRTWKCLWRVNTKPVGGPVLTHSETCHLANDPAVILADGTAVWSDRQAAIDAEVEFLNQFFLERA